MKHLGGAPPKLDKNGEKVYEIERMCKEIDEYIQNCKEKNELMVLKECCLVYGWDYDYVMQYQRNHTKLRQSIKKLLSNKEIFLEKNAIADKINYKMAIFSLKQLGWRDNADLCIGQTDTIKIELKRD